MEQKAIFFDAALNHGSTLTAHFESEGVFTLMYNRSIVEVIIGALLFDQNDKAAQSMRKRVIAIFKLLDDASALVDSNDSSGRA